MSLPSARIRRVGTPQRAVAVRSAPDDRTRESILSGVPVGKGAVIGPHVVTMGGRRIPASLFDTLVNEVARIVAYKDGGPSPKRESVTTYSPSPFRRVVTSGPTVVAVRPTAEAARAEASRLELLVRLSGVLVSRLRAWARRARQACGVRRDERKALSHWTLHNRARLTMMQGTFQRWHLRYVAQRVFPEQRLLRRMFDRWWLRNHRGRIHQRRWHEALETWSRRATLRSVFAPWKSYVFETDRMTKLRANLAFPDPPVDHGEPADAPSVNRASSSWGSQSAGGSSGVAVPTRLTEFLASALPDESVGLGHRPATPNAASSVASLRQGGSRRSPPGATDHGAMNASRCHVDEKAAGSTRSRRMSTVSFQPYRRPSQLPFNTGFCDRRASIRQRVKTVKVRCRGFHSRVRMTMPNQTPPHPHPPAWPPPASRSPSWIACFPGTATKGQTVPPRSGRMGTRPRKATGGAADQRLSSWTRRTAFGASPSRVGGTGEEEGRGGREGAGPSATYSPRGAARRRNAASSRSSTTLPIP